MLYQKAKFADGIRTKLRRALKQLRKDREEEKSRKRAPGKIATKCGRGTGASVGIGRESVQGARKIHVPMGTRNWKTEQPQHEDLANDAEQEHEI